MARKIELKNEQLTLTDKKVEGFLERIFPPIGTPAKADVPRRFLGHRAYVIILKK